MAVDLMEPVLAPQTGEIELGRVERELATLWAAAAQEDPGAEPAVLRACSLNLLVLAGSSAELERARPIAARTTLAHPSRILLLAPDASQSDRNGVGARISTFCHRLGGGGRHVCCEEITVLARGAAAARLREAALPLLVPDLPVHLWLPGSPQQEAGAGDRSATLAPDETGSRDDGASSVVGRLMELADEVIWSARGPEDRLAPSPTRPRPPAGVDLDWLRIEPWRELTAQWFDPPSRRPLLEQLAAVEVVVADPPEGRPGAGWLWVGWLASRLGWEYRGEAHSGAERRFASPEGEVRVRAVAGGADGVPPGELLAVRLQPRGANAPLALNRQTTPDPSDLWIATEGGRCVRLGVRDAATLLGEALGSASKDRVYEAAWELAVRLWQDSQDGR
jgi:glucose-6-phosphate dehydrogenase assembly protein OpcA